MSEFYALVKETSAGLGAVSMPKDLGVDTSQSTKIDKAVLQVRIDASAGRRHIATPTLWVEKLTQEGKVRITRIPGVSNPADLGTKHLDGGSIRRALERCHCFIRDGRSGIALRAEVQENTRPLPEVSTVDDAYDVETQSETEMESIEQRCSETATAEVPNGVNPP